MSVETRTSAGGRPGSVGTPAIVPILSLRNVGVSFGGVTALSGISTDILPNEILAVIGPNGAGKTTLLNAICGLLHRNATGEIFIAGQSVLGKSATTAAKAGIGRSFQDPPLIELATVRENILYGAHLALGYSLADQVVRRRRVREKERAAADEAERVMEFAGLSGIAQRRVAGLPYGTRKLIDVARAMMLSSSVLMLDEPTSGLDAAEQQLVHGILERIRAERSVTVVMVEHHMDFVRATSDRVLGLQAGTLLMEGPPAEVLDSDEFRAAVVGAKRD